MVPHPARCVACRIDRSVMSGFPLSVVVLGSAVALLVGCSDPYVVRTREHDRETMQWALDKYTKREAESPRRRESTLDIARRQYQKDREDTPKNMAELERMIREDRGRWARHKAEIRAEVQRQWAGDPDKARWTLPRLAY